jgi:hypothetical protein
MAELRSPSARCETRVNWLGMTEIGHKRGGEEGPSRSQATGKFSRVLYQTSQTSGPTLAILVSMSQREMQDEEVHIASLDGQDPTGSEIRMRRAISAASLGAGSHEELEAANRLLVAELRAANEPPEQVLLAIKRILAQAGLRPSHPPSDSAMIVERHATVYRHVIASSIRHYFGSNGPGAPA